MKRTLCITRYGFVTVDTDTSEEAIELVDELSDADIQWGDFTSEDAQIVDEEA